MMDHARFIALAEAYGGDIARWPEPERSSAIDFAADSPQAARLLADQRELDLILDAYAASPATADLQRRIVTAAVARGRPQAWLQRWRWPMISAGGALASGMAAGALFIAATAPPPGMSGGERFGPGYAQSSFGDLGLEANGLAGSEG